MTQDQIVIQARIGDDESFRVLCLMRLYEQQEEDEQDESRTKYDNSVGFTGGDSLELSIRAENHLNHRPLDHVLLAKRLVKYARQLTTLLTEDEIY